MSRRRIFALGAILGTTLTNAIIILMLSGYADVGAGLLAVAMAASGIWLSSKGMAQLKLHETDALSETTLETAYRYRNAGIALGLTGSGLLVFSWQSFLARFINV